MFILFGVVPLFLYGIISFLVKNFIILCNTGWLLINPFIVFCLKKVFFFFLKVVFVEYRILGWHFFLFSSLQMLFSGHLAGRISVVIVILISFYLTCLFSCGHFEDFVFIIFFINLIRSVLVWGFLCVYPAWSLLNFFDLWILFQI